jgi:hypothetical protein
MQEVVITLVFSIVLLVVMLYPAIVIAGYIDKRYKIDQKLYLFVTLLIDIVLSLIGGLFLSYF